jgi:bifunctional non-homologous end joining protein LigD
LARQEGASLTDELKIGRRTVRVTHPDKVLFREAKVTKLDLARHYERVAPVMLPYVSGRPLALQAFPNGVGEHGYFMKAVPGYFPDWVRRATVPKRGGTVTHALAEDAATLVYLAGQNVVTLHGWLSKADEPRRPDRLILDFDPSKDGGFADVRAAARDAGDRLRDAGLTPYAMSTGSRGIHVVCPLRRGPTFTDVHRFAKAMAQQMVEESPRKLTLEYLKSNREDKIYVDVNRNAYAQHAVVPYSVRSKPKAPVAVPLHWDELSNRNLRADRWTVARVGDRIDAEGDPWRGMARRARGLPS